MKIVLLSGGSGKRLWPLSSDARSKQFLKILKNEEGQYESMLQRVWRQLHGAGLSSDVHIVASASHIEIIKQQLGDDIAVIVEPERRDTFPAIALSCLYLRDKLSVPDDEVICVLPVDPFVEESYFRKITEFEHILNITSADLALMGTTPTYPSAKYGYIIPAVLPNTENEYMPVSAFFEKPTEQEAEKLIAVNALWNCGVFAFRLSYIRQVIDQHNLPASYRELQQAYNSLKKVSFDISVVEKAISIVAITYKGYWKDLGTWNTFTEEIGERVFGNGVLSEDSVNTHIVNELNIPVFVLNVSNVVVAAGHEGILVTDKPTSPRLKELMKGFEQLTMYEERQWGSYRVLDYFDKDGRRTITKRINIFMNSLWRNETRVDEIHTITIVDGPCIFASQGRRLECMRGEVISVVPGQFYSLYSTQQEIEIIHVQIETANRIQ
ncbi:sugar phosphate nucleotidyltransferase [Cohnella cellulosilytica]|uniref:Sugar phosphate nucleotidyltransferase n=1 Tax=Cohnella cellulosilytica TaxID=986710 RepID=A0ABW2FLZ4_9BACL